MSSDVETTGDDDSLLDESWEPGYYVKNSGTLLSVAFNILIALFGIACQ